MKLTNNDPRNWELTDIDRVMNGDPKDDAILAEELGRSVQAIKSKRSNIKKELRGYKYVKPGWLD